MMGPDHAEMRPRPHRRDNPDHRRQRIRPVAPHGRRDRGGRGASAGAWRWFCDAANGADVRIRTAAVARFAQSRPRGGARRRACAALCVLPGRRARIYYPDLVGGWAYPSNMSSNTLLALDLGGLVVVFSFPAFFEDSRADRVEAHLVTERDGGPTNWLYLLGPSTAANQIELCAGAECVRTPMTETRRADYNYRFEFRDGLPPEIRDLVLLLKKVLSLKTRRYVDVGLALDWYTVPEDGVDSSEWKRSRMGQMQYLSKWKSRRSAVEEITDELLDTISRHPLLREAPTIVTVPGHAGDGKSFGERLARYVAKRAGKFVVNTSSRGPHAESKTGSPHEYGDFGIAEELHGDVLIVDDVYRSGMSMSVAAEAARQAGAERVFGLVVARTLRN